MANRVTDLGQRAWRLAKVVMGRVARHGQMARASQFAYVTFLASIPFVFVLVSVLGLVATPSDYTQLINRARGTIPDQLANFLDGLLQSASASTSQSTIFLVLGLLIGLWLAGNVTGSLTDGLDNALERPHRPWVKGKARALGIAAITGLVFSLTTVMAVLGPSVVRWTFDHVNASGFSRLATELVVAVASAAIFWGYLVMLYRHAPNGDRLRWRGAVLGALVGVGGWLVVVNAFRVYVDNFGSYNRVYGSLGAVVIFLVFLYLTGLTILIGGETSAELHARRTAERPQEPVPPAFP